MKRKFLFFVSAAIALNVSSQSLMIANFEENGTDKMCEKRILEQLTNGKPEAVIEFGVENPQKNGMNPSEKVMKLSNIFNGGIINLNLLGYDDNTQLADEDQIYLVENTLLNYNKLKLKYYIAGTNNPLGANLMPRMELHNWTANPQPSSKYWTNQVEASAIWSDWNEITFDITTTMDRHGLIMLFTYPSWSQEVIEGLTIYIDDVELVEVKEDEDLEPATSLMVANFEGDGTDEMCEKRFTEEVDGSKIRISANPKKTDTNQSDYVLEIYDIKRGGMIDLNLLGYWNNGLVSFSDEDRILIADGGKPLYDKIRMKYYVENGEKTKLDGIKIQLLGPTVSPLDKTWEHPLEAASTWEDWNTVTFDLGTYSACERILLFSYIDWSGSIQEGVKIYIDDVEFINSSAGYTTICPVKDNRQGILTITMDDGYPKSSEYYEQEFVKNDLRGTSVLITNWLNNSPENTKFFQELQTRGRFEYGSHSKTHPNTPPSNDAERQAEIVTSQKELREMFPMQKILTLTLYNGVNYEGANMELAKSTYQAIRGGVRGYNSLLPTDDELYPLKVQGVLDSETVQNMNSWVDVAVEKRQWLIEMWHAIKDYDPDSYAPPTAAVASEHLKYIGDKQKEGLLWVATFNEAVQYVKERRQAKVMDNGLEASPRKVSLTDDLDDNLFDYPLTLCSEVPVEWQYVQVVQGANVQQIASIEKSGKRYVYYNAVPDRGDITLSAGVAPGADITELTISLEGSTAAGHAVTVTASTPAGANDGSIEWFVNGVRQFTVGKTLSFIPPMGGQYGVVAKATSPTTQETVYSNVEVVEIAGDNESFDPNAPAPLMIANFEGDGSDRMCENRFTVESDNVVLSFSENNPNRSGINPSEKVMKLTNVKGSGMINLILFAAGEGNTELEEADRIYLIEDNVLKYDKFRLKYYIEGTNNPLGAGLSPIMELHYWTATNKARPSWTYPLEESGKWADWNEATFDIVTDKNQHGKILLHTYPAWSDEVIEGLAIYIDDIELFNSKYEPGVGTALKENPTDAFEWYIKDRELQIRSLEKGDVLSIFDISGRCLWREKVESDRIAYMFNSSGIYLISWFDGSRIATRKVVVK